VSEAVPVDVIVLGDGAAGGWAAFHAARSGASVAVLAKGLAGRGGSTVSSGGRIAVAGETLREELGFETAPADSKPFFLRNIADAGAGLGDPRLARALVDGIGAELRILIDNGMRFPVTPGGTGRGPGSSLRAPGPDLQRTINHLAIQAGVRFREDFQAVDLLLSEGRVAGVIGVDRRRGIVEAVRAKAVVIATGGVSSFWTKRDTPEELAGEGQAMALRAGAALVDMDFMQFLPCCIVHPQLWRGQQFTWRILGPQGGIHAWLLNRHGERFMARWSPDTMEFAPPDMISAAIADEIASGRGTPGGAVHLSWAHLPRSVLDQLHLWHDQVDENWMWQGHDLSGLKQRIYLDRAVEVAPAAHCSLGGIRIGTHGETATEGLFACGEASGGLHGSNRLQGTAIAQALVQGGAAGLAAAHAAFDRHHADGVDWERQRANMTAPLGRGEGVAPHVIKRQLVDVADVALGARRTPAGLSAALSTVREIREEQLPRLACRSSDPAFNRDWMDALECRAGALVIEAMLLSALERASPAQSGPWNGIVTLDHGVLSHAREPMAEARKMTAA
jgi:succinate dehydrogenase / fumarate reductase flavoprotein subunit/fumarate reductase (CoM/CoB) subunit A